YGVLRRDSRDLVEESRRMDRFVSVTLFDRELVPPRVLLSLEIGRTRRRRVDPRCVDCRRELRQGRLRITHKADRHRVDLADFLRIDVDLNELGWRNRKGVVRIPRTAIGLTERGPD